MSKIDGIENNKSKWSLIWILFGYSVIITIFLFITGLQRTNKFVIWMILPICSYLILAYLLTKLDLDSKGVSYKAFWIFTVLIRIVILFFPVGLSDDIYRYIWDGKVQSHGINPYLYAPDSNSLLFIRDNYWNFINNPTIPTPYPPFSEVFFWFVAILHQSPEISILIIRIIVTLCDLGIVGLLIKLADHFKIQRTIIILYSFSPLVLFEFAGNGHNDAIAIFLMLLSFYYTLVKKSSITNQGISGISLALGILTKTFPIVALPFLAKKWRIGDWISFVVPFSILGLIYYHPGINPFYPPGQMSFVMYFQFNHTIFRLFNYIVVQMGIDANIVRIIYVGIMGIITLKLLIPIYISNTDQDLNIIEYSGVIIFFGLLLGPDIQPWYLLWAFPIAVLFLNIPIIIWSVTVLLSYQIYPRYDSTGVFLENPWILLAEYIPVFLLLLIQYRNKGNLLTLEYFGTYKKVDDKEEAI